MRQIEEKQKEQGQPSVPPSDGPVSPRWAAVIGALCLGLIYAILPDYLRIGPGWLLLVLECVLFLPFFVSFVLRLPLPHLAIRTIGLIVLGMGALALVVGVILLIVNLPKDKQGLSLLRSAALLWCSNILVFALWYWEVDGGGPRKRHLTGHQAIDFLFPQQVDGNKSGWIPHFIDYLFLAFTSATAFSPTDTLPLTRTAKILMMLEAIISLMVIAILASRAINIITG